MLPILHLHVEQFGGSNLHGIGGDYLRTEVGIPSCSVVEDESVIGSELVGEVPWTHVVGDAVHRYDGDALCR